MKFNYITIFALICIFLSACSSDDDANLTNPIIINEIRLTKDVAFIENAITLKINASGYSAIDFNSDKNDVTINEVADNDSNNITYHLNAEAAGAATIEITLSFENFTEIRTVTCEFFEHGFIDFTILEGIILGENSAEHVQCLHGTPDHIASIENAINNVWYYDEKGFWVNIDVINNRVKSIRLNSSPFSLFSETDSAISYPYEIAEGLRIENRQLTMTTVVDRFGPPSEKANIFDTLRSYYYEDLKMLFYFQSDDLDDYEDKIVNSVNVDF